jgi:hypothetical protein
VSAGSAPAELWRELARARLPLHRRMLASRALMRLLGAMPERLRRAAFSGRAHYCPVCESRVRGFMRFGHLSAEWCPVCGAMKRHRLLWAFLRHETNLFDGAPKRVLHVAPEEALEPRLRRVPGLDYVTADLHDPRVQDRVDVMAMPYADGSFDVILCSHVLEHVEDDRAALREFRRVLKPGGWAALMVPYNPHGLTDEDASVQDEAAREERFGQLDHVRYYGRDLVDRMREAGLEAEVVSAVGVLGPEQLAAAGVDAGETVFVGARPA